MADIARMNIMLTAGTSAFTAGMAQASNAVQGFGTAVTGIGATVAGFGAVLGVVAAGAGLVGMVKGSFQAIDALDELASKTGISTEALSRLQYAASFSGIEAEALGSALVKMERNLADAAMGSGEAATALQALGLDPKALTNDQEAIGKIADQLNRIENPAQRVSVAMDIFGKSGADLLPFLAEGSAGMAALATEADKLGITIGGKQAAQVAKANDAIDKIGHAFTGLANSIAIELAPFITYLGEKFVKLVTDSDGIGTYVTAAFQKVTSGIAYAADFLSVLEAGFFALEAGALKALSSTLGGIGKLASALDWIAEKTTGASLGASAFFDNLGAQAERAADKTQKKFGSAFTDFATSKYQSKVTKFFDDIRKGADDVAKNSNPLDVAAKLEESKRLQDAMKKALADQQKVLDTITDLDQKVANFGKSEADLVTDKLKALNAGADQIAQARKAIEDLQKLTDHKSVTDTLKELQKGVDDFGKSEAQLTAEKLRGLGATEEEISTAQRLIKERERLEQLGKNHGEHTASLIEAGSNAAQKITLDATRNPANKVSGYLKESVAEQKVHTTILQDIAESIKRPSASNLQLVEVSF